MTTVFDTDHRTIHEACDQFRSLAKGTARAAEALEDLAHERTQLAEVLAKHGLQITRYGPDEYQWDVGRRLDERQSGTASSLAAAVDAGLFALVADAIWVASLADQAMRETPHGESS